MLSRHNEASIRLEIRPRRDRPRRSARDGPCDASALFCSHGPPTCRLLDRPPARRRRQRAAHAVRRSTRAARAAAGARRSTAALDETSTRLSGALMRVNHVGEVCAQALYSAQALATRDPALRAPVRARRARGNRPPRLDAAAPARARRPAEPAQSALVRRRLRHRPAWRAASATRISLGFVVETERQVEQHLESHLDRLPAGRPRLARHRRADEGRRSARTRRRPQQAGARRAAGAGALGDARRRQGHDDHGALRSEPARRARFRRSTTSKLVVIVGRLAEHDASPSSTSRATARSPRSTAAPAARAGDDEVHVDLREHLRVGRRALGRHLAPAAAHVVAAALRISTTS